MKQDIFISTTINSTLEDLIKLFVLHIFSKHGIPSYVTSDYGPEFVFWFFRSLGKALDIKLHFISGYHLKDNSQTECTNQILEQCLCIFCNYQQDNWSPLLPIAEFVYNNAPSATTSISSFFANKGYHSNITIYPEYDLTSTYAWFFIINLDKLHQELKNVIADAQRHYQEPADTHQSATLDFEVGQQVFVKTKFFHTTRPSKKLWEKF